MHGTYSAGQAIASRELVRLTWENHLWYRLAWGVSPWREASGTLKRLEFVLIEGGLIDAEMLSPDDPDWLHESKLN